MKNKSNFLDNNTIRGIVGIVVILHIFFLLSASYGVIEAVDSLSETLDEINPYRYEEERIEEMLTEDGYEVIVTYLFNLTTNAPFFEWYGLDHETVCAEGEESCDTGKVIVGVDMKSLGTRNDQVWGTLITMSVIYPNAYFYIINIKSPTDTCKYLIVGNTYRSYTEEADKLFTEYENKSLARELYDKVQHQIDNLVSCS